MGGDYDLYELGGRIADATEDLQRARELALSLTGAAPREHPGWPAMETLIDRLDAINRLLAELPGTEIEEAYKQTSDYLDDMSDRADGISY